MYPQLRFVKYGDIDYNLSLDLMHPSTCRGAAPTDGTRRGDVPPITSALLRHFATQFEAVGLTSTIVRATISRWMAINTRATFKESIKNCVDYLCAFSRMNQYENKLSYGKPRVIVERDDALGMISDAITTLLDQLRKDKAEVARREILTIIGADPMERGRLESEELDSLEWDRMITCLDFALASTRQELRERDQTVRQELVRIQIRESRTAIHQAETVTRLTQLAFVFIPISVTCSAFGMNIHELANRPPPGWVSLLVMLGVTLTTIICSLEFTHNVFWSMIKVFKALTPQKLVSTARNWLYKKNIDEEPTREGWFRPEILLWPMRQLICLVKLLRYGYRGPLAMVQRLVR